MADHGARLSLREVAKNYDEVVALHPTTLEVEPGEFFSLIGPSGSGKSTLLGSIAGFIPPSSGRIELDGEDVVGIPPYRRNVGMVFQNYALFPHMTVFENIAFPLRLRKLPSAEVTERVSRLLRMVRLPDFGDRKPSQLSGGQQQRIALARAAVYDPRLLLMDEPLGALDKNLREEMQYEIREFHRQIAATILYVTHDQDEAATMSDRIAIMNHGHVVQYGKPRDLYEHPCNAFVASFLGDANLFEVAAVEKRGGGSATVRVAEGLSLNADGCELPKTGSDRLVACVRPESIRIEDDAPDALPNGHNHARGAVADAVHAAGFIRYRVDIGHNAQVMVRLPSVRQAELLEVGRPVTLSWAAGDTLLIPKE